MKNKNRFMLVSLSLMLGTKMFSMSGALEQQFREEIRFGRWDNAEQILKKIYTLESYDRANKLELELTKAKIEARKKGLTPQPVVMETPPPAPSMERFKPYETQQSVGDQFAHIKEILNKNTPLGLVDKQVLENELNNLYVPQELKAQIEVKLYGQQAPPIADKTFSQAAQVQTGDQFAHIKKILEHSKLGIVDQGILKMELDNPHVPQELKAQIENKLYGESAPALPSIEHKETKTQTGDQYAKIKAILQKPSLSIVDKRILELELENNSNIPAELRANINSKLGFKSEETTPPASEIPEWMKTGGQTGTMQTGSSQ